MSGLHPIVERFMAASAAPLAATAHTLAERRAALRVRSDELFAAFTEPCEEPVTVQEVTIPGPGGILRARIYRPSDAGALTLAPHLVLHGGGWWLGTVEEAIVDHSCRWRAHDAAVAVVALEYRLAPEHPFPAALEDAWTALTWLSEQAPALGLDPARMTVGGASAGANLAAALCLLTARRHGPAITFAALEVPAVDLARWLSELQGGVPAGGEPVLDGTDMGVAIGAYLAAPAIQALDPLVSPLLSDDLHLMPTTQVVTAEHDPLRAEALELVAALRAAGVAVLHLDVEGAVHGAPYLSRVWPPARRWRRAVDHAIREACHPVTPREAIDVA